MKSVRLTCISDKSTRKKERGGNIEGKIDKQEKNIHVQEKRNEGVKIRETS